MDGVGEAKGQKGGTGGKEEKEEKWGKGINRYEKEGKIPGVSLDYLFFGNSPVLCINESQYKLIYALAGSKKGSAADNVVDRITSILDEMGHNKLILRSDQEPAIQELGTELREERRLRD